MRIVLPEDGPGSFKSLMEYAETVIRQSCEMKPDAFITAITEDKEKRMARCMVMSILNVLGVEYERD